MTDASAPILVTRDEAILDDMLRIFAAVGAVPHVCADIGEARLRWADASSVVVGADLAAALGRTAPPRRDGVLLVCGESEGDVWRHAVALGVGEVVALHEEERLVEVLATALEARGEACLVTVVGGCGGAGASTVAAALAMAAARRELATMLVDADPLGGGIDLVVGIENVPGARWPELKGTHGYLAGETLRDVLPQSAGLVTLSWDRGDLVDIPADTVGSVLDAAVRTHDLVVVDLPRVVGPTSDLVLRRSTTVLLVVPEDVRSIGASQRMRDLLHGRTHDVALVSRRRTGGMDADVVSESLGLPMVARVRDDKRVASSVDAGEGPLVGRSLRRSCAALLDELGLVAP